MSDMVPQASETTSDLVHESYELQVGLIIKVGVAVAIISVLAFVGMRLVIDRFDAKKEVEAKARPARLADETGQYAGPNLAENPALDRPDIRADELRRLTTYEFDKQKGTARVPIDRAIDVLVAKGLPTRGTATAKTAAPESAKGAP